MGYGVIITRNGQSLAFSSHVDSISKSTVTIYGRDVKTSISGETEKLSPSNEWIDILIIIVMHLSYLSIWIHSVFLSKVSQSQKLKCHFPHNFHLSYPFNHFSNLFYSLFIPFIVCNSNWYSLFRSIFHY